MSGECLGKTCSWVSIWRFEIHVCLGLASILDPMPIDAELARDTSTFNLSTPHTLTHMRQCVQFADASTRTLMDVRTCAPPILPFPNAHTQEFKELTRQVVALAKHHHSQQDKKHGLLTKKDERKLVTFLATDGSGRGTVSPSSATSSKALRELAASVRLASLMIHISCLASRPSLESLLLDNCLVYHHVRRSSLPPHQCGSLWHRIGLEMRRWCSCATWPCLCHVSHVALCLTEVLYSLWCVMWSRFLAFSCHPLSLRIYAHTCTDT